MTYFPVLRVWMTGILSCYFLIAVAQADFKSMSDVSLKSFWKKGESYQYELKKGKISFLDNIEEGHRQTRQLVTLSVIESSEQGFVMEADYQSTANFLPDNLRQIPAINQLVNQYSQHKVRYAVNPHGVFLGILNGREIQQMLVDMFNAVESSKKLNPEEATVLTNMRCQMTNEVYITEGLFQELRLLHQYYGQVYANNVKQEYETHLANMLEPAGKPIPAHATLKVQIKEDGYCLIEHHLTPDATTMKKLTFDYLNKLSGGVWQAENTESLGMIVKDEGVFSYHLRSGWLVEMLKKRTTTLNDEKTIDYISMKLLEKGSF